MIKNAEYVVYYNTVHNRIRYPYKSYEAVDYLIKNYEFESILDVGSGGGEQASVFVRNGKKVTTLDYGKSYAYEKYNPEVNIISIVADINSYEFNRKYDAVFCSHVWEHQLNVEVFLEKIISAVDEEVLYVSLFRHINLK